MSKRGSYTIDIERGWAGQSKTLLIGMRILTTWPRRNPTHAELVSKFGMSRATAYRWLSAITTARGYLHPDTTQQGSATQ